MKKIDALFSPVSSKSDRNKPFPNISVLIISLFAFVALGFQSMGQATLPTSFSGPTWQTGMPTGWTQSGLGTDYAVNYDGIGGTAGRFDHTADYIQIYVNGPIGNLTYWLAGNGFSGSTFDVQESTDGSIWTSLRTFTTLGAASSYTDAPNSASRYIRFYYTTKVAGNVGIDGVSLTVSCSNPAITGQPGGAQSVCVNGTITPLSITASPATGYQWYSSTTASNTGGTLIPSATSSTYSPSNTTASSLYYYCIISNSTCTTTSTVSGLITVGPAITGTLSVAQGSTITLSGSPTGGSWSSATTSVATVDASTGVVTGVAAGTSVITYSASGCSNTTTVTVTGIGQFIQTISILVDGCDGGNEGMNEMVRFRAESLPVNVADIRVDGASSDGIIATNKWPTTTNSFLGWITPSTPAYDTAVAKIGRINASIVNCGKLIIATGGTNGQGLIPANKMGLIITSTDFSTTADDFSTLSDTLYVVFQIPGNTAGHFGNFNALSSFRTLRFHQISTGTNEDVLYDVSLLTKQNGSLGAQDGGAVRYTDAGVATYFNDGCKAPYIPLNSSWTAPASMCPNASAVNLSSLVTGTAGGSWSGTGVTGTSFNPLGLNGTYPITYTVGIAPCQITQQLDITVNPTPTMSSASTKTICSGVSVGLALTSAVASSYSWVAAANANVSGENTTAQATSTISDILTNTTTSVETVTYTITPTATTGGCAGTPQTVTITVNPTPTMSSASTKTICSGVSVGLALTSAVASSYSWVAAANANVSGENTTAQATSTIGDILTNTTTSVQTVTYTITPTATTGGCAGTPQTVTITVNPTPTMSSASTKTICSGVTVGLALTSAVASSYSWVATANANVSGESTTAQATSTISDILTNTTTSVETVIYTITPTATTGGCAGTPQTVTVTVNPTPSISSANIKTICSGASVGLALTSLVPSSYSWVATDNTNVTGESTTSQISTSISDILTNTSTSAQTVTYTITPTATTGGCAGTPQTVTITVNPTPSMSSASSKTICSGISVGLSLTSAVASSYSWVATANANVTGESTTAQATATISDILINTSTSAQTVIYNITPTATTGGCAGTPQIVTITVNPIDNPAFNYSPATLCQSGSDPTANISGGASGTFSAPAGLIFLNNSTGLIDVSASTINTYTITFNTSGVCPSSSTSTVTISTAPLATFNYAGPYCPSDVNPIPAFGNGANAGVFSASSGLIFANTSTGEINLASSTPGTYTIMNTIAASGGCIATTATNTITINPIPSVTISSNSAICSGNVLNLTSSGGTSYSWSGPDSYSSSNQNPSITNVTINASGTYTVTVTNINGCTATAQTTVTINPKPTASASSNSAICEGATLSLSSSGGTSYNWSGPDSYSSTNQNPSITTAAITASGTYTVAVSNANGCSSTAQTLVTINPNPTATASNNSAICEGATLNLSSSGGTNYSWSGPDSYSSTDQNPAITSTATTASGTYTVTVSNANGCSSTAQTTVTITLNPTATGSSNSAICEGTTLNLTSAGGTSYIWNGPNSYSSTDQNPTITNVSTAATGIYTVTVTNAQGCADTENITVVINPLPSVTLSIPDNSYCVYANPVTLTGSPAGGSFSGQGVSGNTFSPSTAGVGTNYQINYDYIDANGCSNSNSVLVSVIDMPVVDLIISPSYDIIYTGQNVILTANPANYTNYTFYVDNNIMQNGTSNVYQSSTFENGQVVNVIVSESGCTENDSVVLNIKPFPNAFTPDGSSKNNIFLKGLNLTIINRWGQELYSGTEGWDGKYNGKAVTPGTYFYIVKLIDANKTEKTLQGSVTLVNPE